MKPKVSLIITTLNEESTILKLLQAILKQTLKPDEVIITDGGSDDSTCGLIQEFSQKHPQLELSLITKPGANISQGRNIAIKKAKHPVIAITDAGCVPQPDWLQKLIETYQETKAPVIAGYYHGLANSPLEEAIVPYILVMPDQLDPNSFLPASRSMLLEKSVWKKIGGFNEKLAVSEDFAFAHQLVANNVKISFCQQAQVGWMPRSSLKSFFQMIAKFGEYDIRAGIIRQKVNLIFARYGVNLLILFWLWPQPIKALIYLIAVLSLYSAWSIQKNKKYTPNGWYWLPVLQITADLAVMLGTLKGYWSRVTKSATD